MLLRVLLQVSVLWPVWLYRQSVIPRCCIGDTWRDIELCWVGAKLFCGAEGGTLRCLIPVSLYLVLHVGGRFQARIARCCYGIRTLHTSAAAAFYCCRRFSSGSSSSRLWSMSTISHAGAAFDRRYSVRSPITGVLVLSCVLYTTVRPRYRSWCWLYKAARLTSYSWMKVCGLIRYSIVVSFYVLACAPTFFFSVVFYILMVLVYIRVPGSLYVFMCIYSSDNEVHEVCTYSLELRV